MGERKAKNAIARELQWFKSSRQIMSLEAWLGALREAFPVLPRGLPRGVGKMLRFYSNALPMG
jgi:hypothetical protein